MQSAHRLKAEIGPILAFFEKLHGWLFFSACFDFFSHDRCLQYKCVLKNPTRLARAALSARKIAFTRRKKHKRKRRARWLFCLRWPLPLEERAPAPADQKTEQGRVSHPPPGSAFSSAGAGVALPLFWRYLANKQKNGGRSFFKFFYGG